MTGPQRFESAIAGGIPDRVPAVPKIYVDCAARLTGRDLATIVQDPLQALLAIAEAGELCGVDAVRQFHFPKRRTRPVNDQLVEIDTAGNPIGRVDLSGGLATRLEDPDTFEPNNEIFMAFHHFWTCEKPVIPDIATARDIVVPPRTFYEHYGCGDRQRTVMAEYGDRLAIIGDCNTATMAFLVNMRGMYQAMVDLVDDPALVHAIMEKGVQIAAERGKFNLDLGLRVLRINDSVGNMSVISPDHWREFVFPHLRDLCTELHRYLQEAKLYCHICGNIMPIVEDLLETGLDCIAPLDPLGGFTPADVRERVGDAVALMGGVNTMTFLEGTPADVMAEAETCIEQAGVDGGFILGSGCVVPPASSLDNLRALARASEFFGTYEAGQLKKERSVRDG